MDKFYWDDTYIPNSKGTNREGYTAGQLRKKPIYDEMLEGLESP